LPKSSELPIAKLGTRYVEWIHDDLIGTLWPDIDPVSRSEYRDVGLLESALARPFHSAGGQDAYPSLLEKASALFHSLISNHPFQNGNKRTGVIAVDAFLVGNGYAMALSNDKMYELAQRTASYRARGASHDDSFSDIAEIFAKWAVPLVALYRQQKLDKSLSIFYRSLMVIRRSVRRHRGNMLIQRH
jgi:death-on-curing family protein